MSSFLLVVAFLHEGRCLLLADTARRRSSDIALCCTRCDAHFLYSETRTLYRCRFHRAVTESVSCRIEGKALAGCADTAMWASLAFSPWMVLVLMCSLRNPSIPCKACVQASCRGCGTSNTAPPAHKPPASMSSNARRLRQEPYMKSAQLGFCAG